MKQLIFDCDGVLVDTEIMAAEIMVELLRSYGLDIDMPAYIQSFTGKTFTGILDAVELELSDDLEAIAKQVEQRIYAELRAIEGMSELLLAQELPISIVSNSATWQVEKAIKFLGLEQVINGNYFSSQMVARPKPFPDIYLRAAEKNNVHTQDCLVIEDSLSGATAALDAGMNVIGFCGASHIQDGHNKKLLDLGVTETARDADELKLIINRLTANQPDSIV